MSTAIEGLLETLRSLRARLTRSKIRLDQPPLPAFGAIDRNTILRTLMSFTLDDAGAGELGAYAKEDCDRFLHTVGLVPERRLSLLEIGANPYFTSYMLRKFRPQAICRHTNYGGGPVGNGWQRVSLIGFDGKPATELFDYTNINLEEHTLPMADASLDVVLFCEVIEHLLNDPLRALAEIKRTLRPDGHLILTTPNVARLENVARLLAGDNIYDPYSGYGPYGRHNREYSRLELVRLLEFCGFTIETIFSANVHRDRAADYFPVKTIEPLVAARKADLGQYLFVRCRNTGPMPATRPTWLYRSYPAGQLTKSNLKRRFTIAASHR